MLKIWEIMGKKKISTLEIFLHILIITHSSNFKFLSTMYNY